MAKSRFRKILSHVFHIQPGEERLAFLLFSYFFLITSPYYIIKPLRDAVFLNRLGYENLPLAYLLTAVIVGVVVSLHSKLQVKASRLQLLIFSLLLSACSCLLFMQILPFQKVWIPLVFWIWTNVFIIVLVTQFWILVNDIFNPREAKRLIGMLGSSGILGGIGGGILAAFITRHLSMEFLLPLASVLLIFAFGIVLLIFKSQRKPDSISKPEVSPLKEKQQKPYKVGFKDSLGVVWNNSYLRLIAASVTLTWIVSTLIDFQFKGVINITIPSVDEMTVFFAYFNTGLLVFSFFFQLLATSNLIKRFGIRFTLQFYPAMILLCSLGIALSPVFFLVYFAVLIKGADKSLSYSLNQSVRELLYIPIPQELKYRAKIFIDMFLNRFAKGMGAVLLLTLLTFSKELRWVSLLSVVLLLLWIFINFKISTEYANSVRQKLKVRWERAEKIIDSTLDMDFVKSLVDTIEEKNRSSVLYAMNLFDMIQKNKLTPEVQSLLSSQSSQVRASSLGTFFGSEEMSVNPEINGTLDKEALIKDVEEISSLDVYQEVMKGYFEKVLETQKEGLQTEKMEIAKAIGFMSRESSFVSKLGDLILDNSPEVSRYALESAAKLKKREFIHAVVLKLSHPATEKDSEASLEKYGEKIAGTLSDYLGDENLDVDLRKKLAFVLSRMGTQEAVNLIVMELAKNVEEMGDALIDALDNIRSGHPDLLFPRDLIKKMTFQEIQRYCNLFIQLYEIHPSQKEEKLQTRLKKELDSSFKNLFKLLGLIYSHKEILTAYQNILIGKPEAVSFAVELLDNILPLEMKHFILPVVEDTPFEEKIKKCRTLVKGVSKLCQ